MKSSLRCLALMLFVCCWLWMPTSNAADKMKSPFTKKKKPPVYPTYQTSTVKWFWQGAIRTFSTVISPVDGPRSPSYPTGSAYGRQAIEKHGFFVGVLLIGDRLFHESDRHLGPTIEVYGKTRFYDPVESNTFWWDTK